MPAPFSLLNAALRLLARREHSRTELEHKLQAKADSTQALAEVLNRLESKGFISPHRVAQSVLNQRSAQWGNARLRQVMQAKGLSKDLIESSLQCVEQSEEQRAYTVWQRKYGTAPSDTKERARQTRFLLARGFPYEVVTKLLKQASD